MHRLIHIIHTTFPEIPSLFLRRFFPVFLYRYHKSSFFDRKNFDLSRRILEKIQINCQNILHVKIELLDYVWYTKTISQEGVDDLCVIQLQEEILR